ncbi:nucleoid-associated protein [Aeromonas veronii]|uniref:nucleoid-associated protein n=1 Tax=Aeromonas veronii TaxID=654 RepID=UPI003B9F423A
MAQLIESTVSDKQKEGFIISDFIFHIIDIEGHVENDGVVYLDEITLNDRQKKFFLDRIKDATSGTQYIYSSEIVRLKRRIDDFEDQEKEVSFNEFSRLVTKDFAKEHSGNMSSGIFVVCKVSYPLTEDGEQCKFIFLVKMDKQASFKYSFIERDGRRIATIEENLNSLGEKKDTIQKSALIDISNQYKWNMLAYDRTKKPDLSDYFREFLGVIPRQTNTSLTRITHKTVKDWAKTLPDECFPEGEDANTFSGRSLNYLCDIVVFDTDAFINTIVRDEDQKRREAVSYSLKLALTAAGVAGQTFTPQPKAIARKDRRQVYLTEEGVTISYEGSPDAANIVVKRSDDGSATITIHTNGLIIK